MSQLKKQSIAARHSSRRNQQRSTRSGKNHWSSRRLVSTTFRWIIRGVKLIGRPLIVAGQRWPRAVVTLTASGLVLAGMTFGINQAIKSLAYTLPEVVEVNDIRSDLYQTVERIATDTLRTARAERWSRRALADKLLSRISLLDGVDEVSLRTGLDRKLKIHVAAQAPLMVLEGKGGERVLVGSKYDVIVRSLGAHDYSNLPRLDASELPLNLRSPKERKREHDGLFFRPSTATGVNVRWLSQQTIRIHTLIHQGNLPAELDKVSWRDGTGFSVTLKIKDASAHEGPSSAPTPALLHPNENVATPALPSKNLKTVVIFGDGQFVEKFNRLSQILQDIRLKKSMVEQIDLGFSDKAIIRMSENISDSKRGGAQ
jgi:hypothetical protein